MLAGLLLFCALSNLVLVPLFQNGEGWASAGGVIRDSNDLVIACFSKRIKGYFSVKNSELIAIREGLLLAVQNKLQVNFMECDVQKAVQSLSSNEEKFADNASLVCDVNNLFSLASCVSFRYVPRIRNAVALLVDIDLKNPLLVSIQVKSRDDCRFVYLSYERLPDFCYTCSSIGHIPSNCYHNKLKEDKKKITKKSEGSALKQQVYVAKPITNQVVFKDIQKSPDVPVKKILTSLASDLDKDNTLVHFGNMEDEVKIVDSLEKNKAHYDKDDKLAVIDENVNTKEDVALNYNSEYISNIDKVVNTQVYEEHIEALTTEVGIFDLKYSSSFVESKSNHSLDTSDLSPTKVFTSKDEGWQEVQSKKKKKASQAQYSKPVTRASKTTS
ncbi:Zinc finger, CCHC-type [Parasponia andersonii]|uniref:Zinc finger, CCHC-type n=1 Tax=Parasponia andersonii TaxID=3476 RepID=A0A2P5DGE7_PARAD|nr:Zinc finger, CCHC-type [Parasponia andersonii]